jgi:heterodisulfide reductase subunit A
MTLSEVKAIKGSVGDFTVQIKKNARYVDIDACIGCDACFEPCPVSLKNEFEESLSERKAIYTPCAGTLPNVPCIDTENCVRFKGEDCQACKEACMFEAINFEQKDEELELNVGAIVVATGFSPIDLSKSPKYGYKKFDNVYSAFEFERLYASNGPTEGKIVLKNGEQPKSAVIIHCVGREEKGYCSAVCCMYSLKFIHYLKDKLPDIKITELHSDLCIPGKSYQKFYEETTKKGVDLIRSQDAEVIDDGITVKYKNENGEEGKVVADMVILTPALEPRANATELAKVLEIPQDENGFFKEEHSEFASVAAPKKGIYIAGCAQSPKDIQSTITDAQATVGRILAEG